MRLACALGKGSLALLLLVGCATAANEGHVETQATTLSSGGTCGHAKNVASTPSTFDGALLTYSVEGATANAISELDAACNDEQGACTILALVYASGEGVTRDQEKAKAYRSRALRLPRLHSLDLGSEELGELYREQGLHIRIESSNCYFNTQPCEHGCEDTCSAAATATKSRAAVPLQRACEKGRGAACHVLAYLTEYGATLSGVGHIEGGEQDAAKALRTKACTLGVAESCARVDVARACSLGLPSACLTQGDEAMRRGDNRLAASIYERACELGMKGVCRDLAAILGTGQSRAKDAYLKVFGGEDEVKAAHFRELGGSDAPVTAEEL